MKITNGGLGESVSEKIYLSVFGITSGDGVDGEGLKTVVAGLGVLPEISSDIETQTNTKSNQNITNNS